MRVNTHARNKTSQQVEQYPYYFAAKSFVQGFRGIANAELGEIENAPYDYEPPPYELMRAIITGRFAIVGRPKRVWQYRPN